MFPRFNRYTRVVNSGLVATDLAIGEFGGHCGRFSVHVDKSASNQCQGETGRL